MKPTHARYWVVVFALALAMIMYIQRVAISQAIVPISADLHLNKAADRRWCWAPLACPMPCSKSPWAFWATSWACAGC